ncbi:hypothetical protein [Halomarina rubra]|uniref:Uncharacterized protein n=1 Tax=Halomarina rubra TaxID=2071873 RepID=A0ABD6AYX2_9EURY|nr:hypothetical protein [Halomarina rubra]
MPSRRHVLAVLVAALLLVPVVGAVVAAPPPESLCGTCGLSEDHYDDGSVVVDPTNSSVEVELFENGSSRWTERVRVVGGAEGLTTNATLRSETVERAFHRHVVDDDERVDTRLRVEGETLVTTYRVPGLGAQSMGVLTVGEFHRTGNEPSVYVGAARATLVAPEGYHLVDGPDGSAAETTPDGVVWTSPDATSDYAPRVEGRLTFGDDETLFPALRGLLAAVVQNGPVYLGELFSATVVPGVALTVSGLALTRRHERRDEAREPAAIPLVALGVVVVAIALVTAKLAAGSAPIAPALALSLAVPTALFVALGAIDGARRRWPFLVALGLFPVGLAVAFGIGGAWSLLVFVPVTVLTLALGIPAFSLGRAL